MIKTLTLVSLLGLSAGYSHCQTVAQAPAFEVASITPCKPGTPEPPMEHTGLAQFTSPGGRFRASATTLKFLLEWAYGIQPSQHSDGPSWIANDRYDIVATAEGNPTEAQMQLMMQTLLADRFKLKLHRERKEIQAYVLSLGKTAPKLSPPKAEETHALRFAQQVNQDQKVNRVFATRYTLTQLTDTFARQMGAVILNQTGLDGEFDFTIDISQDEG